jgi:ribosome-associated translation inhibitor RaiA
LSVIVPIKAQKELDMQKKITFRNMAHSDVAEKYAYDQFAKIEDFLKNERTPITIDLIFTPGHIHAHHRVELLVKTPNYDLVTHYEGPEFYDVIDRVIDTMHRNLLEEKDKHMEDRKMVGRHDEFKKQR